VVPVWLVASALGFSVFVSMFAGLYPASRAARSKFLSRDIQITQG